MDSLDEKCRWLSIGLIGGIAVGALATWVILPRGSGMSAAVWQPAGDGRTVLNTLTGETKETIPEREVSAVAHSRGKPGDDQAGRTLIRSSEEIYENECKRFFGDRQASHRRQNAPTYDRLSSFVKAHPEIDGVGSISQFSWELSTRAFRVDQPLTPGERDRLLGFLEKANKVDRYKHDASFQQAIADLRGLRY